MESIASISGQMMFDRVFASQLAFQVLFVRNRVLGLKRNSGVYDMDGTGSLLAQRFYQWSFPDTETTHTVVNEKFAAFLDNASHMGVWAL